MSPVKDLEQISPAFRAALLTSERFRVKVVLSTLAAFFLERSIRTLLVHGPEDIRLWATTATIILVFAIYEIIILRGLQRLTATEKGIPAFAWYLTVFIETALPAFALVLLTSDAISPEYKPLANPLGLAFFIFIILSTLRLNPWDSWIAGFASALNYLVASWYLGWRPDFAVGTSVLTPQRSVMGYAIALILGGLVAGAVANEIRKHVMAALREAEVQREVERLQHDLNVARTIQRSLLPGEPPKINGFEVAGWNLPADETGGDFFDWQFLPNGKLLVALADVTGHGIGPALLASVCRAYARANFSLSSDLFRAMQRINADIGSDLTQGRFVTFVAAICEPNSPRVDLLSAGHGPLFVYFVHEDRFQEMKAQGLPLGVADELDSEPPVRLEMNPGDMLLLITDGFLEWENASREQFGVKRMEQVIRETKTKPPMEIIQTLYKEVIAFSGGTPQNDDLTAVVVKRT
jgi:serine phosphatase RsbU (regulator of sigma subunit)